MPITHSPWGAVQTEHVTAEGITFVSTAGHGGYHLSPDRCDAVRKRFPEFEPWAGFPWFEEDCDCCVVFLTFPEHFSIEAIRAAVNQVGQPGRDYFHYERIWLEGTPEGRELVARVRQFEKLHAQEWERGSMWAGGNDLPRGYWAVSLHRVGNYSERQVRVMSYPEKNFYTTEELAAFPLYVRPEALKPKEKPKPVRNEFREEDCSGVYDGIGNVFSDADPGL